MLKIEYHLTGERGVGYVAHNITTQWLWTGRLTQKRECQT